MSETDLYRRTIEFDYGDAERNDLMNKVWSVTPFMINAQTGGHDDDRYREIRDWCRREFGDEAWPIHGHPGNWQFGGATIFGQTFIGFATESQLRRFLAAFPHIESLDNATNNGEG